MNLQREYGETAREQIRANPLAGVVGAFHRLPVRQDHALKRPGRASYPGGRMPARGILFGLIAALHFGAGTPLAKLL
jgi:hypothetical protein